MLVETTPSAVKPLVVSTLKEFVAKMGITQVVPTIRINVNKYPFITFIDGMNKAENVYFSKTAAKALKDNVVTKELLSGLSVAYDVKNEKGEIIPYKLISNSERVNIDSLLD